MYGAICRLNADDTLDQILNDGRTTISLGYMGIYEAVLYLTGESNTSEKGEKLALEIIKHLKDAVDSWKKETGIGFGLYGTPRLWAYMQ
jgi:ribonucleoside-triphosphate reductase